MRIPTLGVTPQNREFCYEMLMERAKLGESQPEGGAPIIGFLKVGLHGEFDGADKTG